MRFDRRPVDGRAEGPVAHGGVRRYPELPHPYRNEFQRDRDRVVHARAFRRLENKTQVFAPGLSDHFRNRLTHTIGLSPALERALELVIPAPAGKSKV